MVTPIEKNVGSSLPAKGCVSGGTRVAFMFGCSVMHMYLERFSYFFRVYASTPRYAWSVVPPKGVSKAQGGHGSLVRAV